MKAAESSFEHIVDAQKNGRFLLYFWTSLCKERLIPTNTPERGKHIKALVCILSPQDKQVSWRILRKKEATWKGASSSPT